MADPAIVKCVHSSVSFVGAKCQLCGLGQYLVSLFGIYFYHPLESWAPVIRFVANPSAGGYTQVSVWHVWNRVVFGSPKACRILMDTENYSYMCVLVCFENYRYVFRCTCIYNMFSFLFIHAKIDIGMYFGSYKKSFVQYIYIYTFETNPKVGIIHKFYFQHVWCSGRQRLGGTHIIYLFIYFFLFIYFYLFIYLFAFIYAKLNVYYFLFPHFW